jgi:hypothetical protein
MNGCASSEWPMRLRHGSRTEPNAIAETVRVEVGLRLTAPLDPWQFAHRVDIPVVALSEPSESAAVRFATSSRSMRPSCRRSRSSGKRPGRRLVRRALAGAPTSNVARGLAQRLSLHEPSQRSITTAAVCGTQAGEGAGLPDWRAAAPERRFFGPSPTAARRVSREALRART